MIKNLILSPIKYTLLLLMLIVFATVTVKSSIAAEEEVTLVTEDKKDDKDKAETGFETDIDPVTGAEYAKGEFIIKYKDWDKREPKDLAKNSNKSNEVKSENDKAKTVLVKVDDSNLDSFRKDAQKLDENIEFIEPNYVVRADATPLDSLYAGSQKVMWDGQSRYEQLVHGYIQEDMRFDGAWNSSHGSSSTIIAILDSGINSSHQELTGKVVAADNFINPGSSSADDNGHGTIVASIAAANANFSSATTGMAGACPNCSLLNGKVLNSSNAGTINSVADGLYWAKDNGAHIINASISLGTNSLVLYDALQYVKAGGNNVTVVVAAGNTPLGFGYLGQFPNTIGVGWLDADGTRNALSNYGEWVDVMAYGTTILAADYTGTSSYTSVRSGTSMATPFVAGTVGLMYSRGDLPSSNRAGYARKTIINSARETTAAWDADDVLDANAAMTTNWVVDSSTTSSVGFYTYQDNNNNGILDIADVCLKHIPLDMEEYVSGSWSSTTAVPVQSGSKFVIANSTDVTNCKNAGNQQTLVIDREYEATNTLSDNSISASAMFLPDYSFLQVGVRHEKFGDCNGDGAIDAGDLTATHLEIFDGDGNSASATLGGTYPFTRFCDSNRDTVVDAGDLTCTANKIFNPSYSC